MGFKPTDTTLAKVADDEPIFVLRAQDMTAPAVVLHWIELNLPYASEEKLREAFEQALAMRRWPNRKRYVGIVPYLRLSMTTIPIVNRRPINNPRLPGFAFDRSSNRDGT